MTYDYLEEETQDVLNYLTNESIFEDWSVEDFKDLNGIENYESKLFDDLWTDDSVTGNGSGSYTFSSYKAAEYLTPNLDLLAEVAEEFGGETLVSLIKDGPEACDVAIRCYLLPEAISNALNEYEPTYNQIYVDKIEDSIRDEIDETDLPADVKDKALNYLEKAVDQPPEDVISDYESYILDAEICIEEAEEEEEEEEGKSN